MQILRQDISSLENQYQSIGTLDNNTSSIKGMNAEQFNNQLLALNDKIRIIDSRTNRTSALVKLNNYIDTYLYVIKFLDQRISNYLKESQEAINFYYTVEDQRTGIKFSF